MDIPRPPNRVLITAGPVYGKLDANKIVSNRSSGLWAASLANLLASRGHFVYFVIPKVGVNLVLDHSPNINNDDLFRVLGRRFDFVESKSKGKTVVFKASNPKT